MAAKNSCLMWLFTLVTNRTRLLSRVGIAVDLVFLIVLAAAVGASLLSWSRVVLMQSELNTYVRLAAQSHASLNFERGTHYLLSPVLLKDRPSGHFETNEFPVLTKWDSLYIALYNERMRSLLFSKGHREKEAQ